jgi:hypothetical protein
MTMDIAVVRDVTPCILKEAYSHFREDQISWGQTPSWEAYRQYQGLCKILYHAGF